MFVCTWIVRFLHMCEKKEISCKLDPNSPFIGLYDMADSGWKCLLYWYQRPRECLLDTPISLWECFENFGHMFINCAELFWRDRILLMYLEETMDG